MIAGLVRRVTTSPASVFAALRSFFVQLLVVALNMGTGVLTARLLGPAGRGLFAAATLWPQTLTAIFSLGLPAAIVFHMRGEPTAKQSVYTASMVLSLLLSAMAAVAGGIAVPLLMRSYSLHDILITEIGVAVTIPYFFFNQLRQAAVALHSYGDYNTSSWLPPVVYLLLLLAAWLLVGLTAENSSLCLYASWIIAGAWLFHRLWAVCRPQARDVGLWTRRVASYSMRGATGDILAGLAGSIDRLVLVFLISPESLGLYAVAFSFSRLMNLVLTIVNTIFFSKLVGRPAAEIIVLHHLIFRLVLYFVVVAAGAAILLGRFALTVFYGHAFAVAEPLFVLLTLEAGFSCLAQVSIQTFYALDAPGYASVAQTTGFATVLGCALLLAPTYGADGAAWAMLAAGIVRMGVALGGLMARFGAAAPRLYPTREDFEYIRGLMRA